MQNIREKAVRPIDSEADELLRSIQAYEYRLNFYKNLNKNLEKVELIVKFFALTTDLPQNSCGLGWTY